MQLIRRVQVRRFRSLFDVELRPLGDMTALVGKNSSGKSNVLRALNAFFSGEVEPGKGLAFPRDRSAMPPSSNKKKVISVEVDFELPPPPHFKLRDELNLVRNLGTTFTITRTWVLDPYRTPVSTFTVRAGGEAVTDPDQVARQFLALINYRYVPARTVPADLLRLESQAIADSVFIRMKGNQSASDVLDAIRRAAERFLEHAQKATEATGAPFKGPSIATAATLGEMLSMSGFQAKGPYDMPLQDEDWGAGHQAFFLYQVLHAVDTSYSRFFGWKQATVWGIEEPESGLHRDLETRLAERLRSWTHDPATRLQIIETTHSPVLTMASDAGYWCELNAEARTEAAPMAIAELVRAAELRGVSPWIHPILSYPWSPVVLVEGHSDTEALTHVASLLRYPDLRFVDLPKLDPGEKGRGKDAVRMYLERHGGLVNNRPRGAPLLVLLDWDVPSDELRKVREAYGPGGSHRVTRMDADYSDPALGTSFKGIERFYPLTVIESAIQDGELAAARTPNRPYSVARTALNDAKYSLLQRVKAISDLSQLTGLVRIVRDLRAIVDSEIRPQTTIHGLDVDI